MIEHEMIEQMVFIRLFEEQLSRYYDRGIFRCPVHLSVGHEASAVGVCNALRRGDKVFGHHRSHHHYLAKGGDPRLLLLEMLGSAKGCSRGMGGSTHLVDEAVGFLGSAAIIAALLPVASGYSHGMKLLGNKNLVVAFCGDAAVEEGTFFETVNMAKLWGLPLLVVIEDNSFSCDTPKASRYGFHDLSQIGKLFDINFSEVVGSSVMNVFKMTNLIRNRILDSSNPEILHVRVARAFEHCGPKRKEDIRWKSLEPLRGVDPKYFEVGREKVLALFDQVLAEEGILL